MNAGLVCVGEGSEGVFAGGRFNKPIVTTVGEEAEVGKEVGTDFG